MQLTNFARQLPADVWRLFQPLLPPVIWCGNGRKPASNYDCLHALFHVLVSGILASLVVAPPPPEVPVQRVDPRSLPHAQADGAYGNKPTPERAQRAGFRLQAPKRGEARPGVGKIRNAVERCHNFLAQFGRVFRHFDRSARHYLAWLEMAACVILLRSGFVA